MRGNLNLLLHQDLSRYLFHHRVQIQKHSHRGQQNGHGLLNIARYKKTVPSALWVQLTLVTCYLPAGIVTALVTIKESPFFWLGHFR